MQKSILYGLLVLLVLSEGIVVKMRIRGVFSEDDDFEYADLKPNNTDYGMAKILSDYQGYNKAIFGAYNLWIFTEMIKVDEDTRPIDRDPALQVKCKEFIEGHRVYGDQNYGLELFISSDSVNPILHIDRGANSAQG